MKKLIQRIGSGLLCIMILALTACSGKSEGESVAQGGGNDSQVEEKGRYLETEYTVPEDADEIHDIKRLEDGTLRLASGSAVYSSADMGQTWEKVEAQTAVTAEWMEKYAMDMAIDSQGRVFAWYYSGESILIDTDGSIKTVEINLPEVDGEDSMDNMMYELSYTAEGNLLGSDLTSSVYEVDTDTGEILRTYKDISGYKYAVVGDKLISLEVKGLAVYNRETGAVEEIEPALKSYFESNSDDEGFISFTCDITAASDEAVYYADTNGLYRYTFGASEMELLIPGNLSSMGNPANGVSMIVEGDNHTFLILYSDTNSGKYSLKQYEYSAEASATPKYEISVYSLNDSDNLRSAIANFQSANPDYFVNLEIGMSGQDGITSSDAISTLNTNIMAGNGPDILMLEGLHYESYIEKGLLSDLGGLVEEQRQEAEYYEPVLTSLKTEEGLYGIPTRFKIPVIEGVKTDIDAVTDLASLRQMIQDTRNSNPEVRGILGEYTAEQLIKTLLGVYQPQILSESGTVDEAALKKFLEESKAIYDVNLNDNTQEEGNVIISGTNAELVNQMFPILTNAQKMLVGWIESVSDLQYLAAFNERMEWDHDLLTLEDQKTFIPIDAVGINAKTSNMDHSQLFVKYLMSEEMQSNLQLKGLPVNKNAMDMSFENQPQEGSMFGFSFVDDDGTEGDAFMELNPVSKEAYEWLKQVTDETEVPVVGNAIITDAVTEAGASYLNGESKLADAVDAVLKTVNLYLSE